MTTSYAIYNLYLLFIYFAMCFLQEQSQMKSCYVMMGSLKGFYCMHVFHKV